MRGSSPLSLSSRAHAGYFFPCHSMSAVGRQCTGVSRSIYKHCCTSVQMTRSSQLCKHCQQAVMALPNSNVVLGMPYIHSDCCDAPAGIYHSTSDPVAILSSRAGFVEKTETEILVNTIAVHQSQLQSAIVCRSADSEAGRLRLSCSVEQRLSRG